MTVRGRTIFLAAAALAAAVQARAAGTVDAWGIVSWNSNGAFTEAGSASGISQTSVLANGQVVVAFSSPGYQSLKSTVLVTCRSSLPCFITWDTFGSNSVRVRQWDAAGAPLPAGSFSIALIRRPNVPAQGGDKDGGADATDEGEQQDEVTPEPPR